MMISIIISALNEENNIANCLVSLQNQDYDDYEIIVIDNNSSDRTGDIVSHFKKVKLYIQKEKSPALAKNLGASKAKGDILLFTDADELFNKDYVRKLAEPIINGKCLATKPYLVRVTNTGKKETMAEGNFRCIKKSIFNKLGGYQANKGYADDRIDGFKDIKDVKVVLIHNRSRDTIKANYFKGIWIGESYKYSDNKSSFLTLLHKIGYNAGFLYGLLFKSWKGKK